MSTLLVFLFSFFGLAATAQQSSLTPPPSSVELSLIPYPQSVEITGGYWEAPPAEVDNFTLPHSGAPAYNEGKRHIAALHEASLGEEAYRLTITPEGVRIAYGDEAGLFYAKQTLRQLWRLHGHRLPCLRIADKPLLRHRGFMIDEARHFFGKEQIKKMLDVMAAYKLNRFHWHLTDDQGWRIEIPEYPLLTTRGAERKGSLINRSTSPWFYDDTPYGKGMYYTLNDLREIVAYAAQRHIEIIPEVDIPGHMVAALAAYPELSCDPARTYEVRIDAGVDENVLNVGDDKVIAFLKTVLSQVAQVFPSKYIHIGGDECPTKVWETNPLALQRIQDKGLNSVHDLQPWLAQELGAFLDEKYGKTIIVWDELLQHWPKDSKIKPIAMAWRGMRYAKQAAEKGLASIAVPVYPMYFDLMQVDTTRTIVEEVYQGGYGDPHVTSMDKVYAFHPISEAKGYENYLLGTQANLWTETVRNGRELEYCALPRLLALSETAWLPAEKKNWQSFIERLQPHGKLLDEDKYTYARHFFYEPSPTAADSIDHILSKARPDAIGYPSKAAYKALAKARKKGKNLVAALRHFQQSPLTLPKNGQRVRLLSASTYYKRKYAGAVVYAGDSLARVHFTPQGAANEEWTVLHRGKGFVLTQPQRGELAWRADGKAGFAQEGTVFFLQTATAPFKGIGYAHGAVVLTDAAGKGLYIAPTAALIASPDLRLTHPATWRLEEVRK